MYGIGATGRRPTSRIRGQYAQLMQKPKVSVMGGDSLIGSYSVPISECCLGTLRVLQGKTLARRIGDELQNSFFVMWDSGRNDRSQPRRADDVTRESGTECAIRRWLQ